MRNREWSILGQICKGRQYLEKMRRTHDLDPNEVPNKQWTSDPC